MLEPVACVDPEIMLVSLAYAATESMASSSHADVLDICCHGVHGLCCVRGLLLMSMVYTAAGDYAEACGTC